MLSLMSRFASIYRSVPMSWDGLFGRGKKTTTWSEDPADRTQGISRAA